MGCLTQFLEVFLGLQAAGFSYKEPFLLHFCALSDSYKPYIQDTVRGGHEFMNVLMHRMQRCCALWDVDICRSSSIRRNARSFPHKSTFYVFPKLRAQESRAELYRND